MKKIGIVGGVGWRSTAEYYSEICRRSEALQLARDRESTPAIPEMSIESLDLARAIAYLGRGDNEQSWQEFDEYHRASIRRLEASGADFALIASNTCHHRFDAITRGIKIPIISIVEAAAKASARIGAVPGPLIIESDDLRKDFEELQLRGVKFADAEPEDYPFGVRVTALDPDGNRVSLRQRRK
jgi:aspartate/glutamate racemase